MENIITTTTSGTAPQDAAINGISTVNSDFGTNGFIESNPKPVQPESVEELKTEIEKLKKNLSKANSENADWKRKYNAFLDEDGKKKLAEEEAKAADAQRYADLEAKYNEILKKSTISEYKAKYLAQGYDEPLAEDTAKALESGDMAKVFENAEKFKKALEAKIKADLMDNTPKPNGGAGGNVNPVVEQAKNIGKAKAEANKASADVLKHYGI